MNPWMQVTGWTLIHFVWQGALLALATAAGLQLLRHRSSEIRYAVACVGLTAMLVSPAITAWIVSTPESGSARVGSVVPGIAEPDLSAFPRAIGNASSPVTPASTSVKLEQVLPVVVWAWLAGVTLLLARFAGGCWRIHRLRRASLAETVSRWQAASERLGARLGLKVPFRVVESGLVDAPSVIGWLRPVILLPLAALTNLSPSQIEAVLAHELAHIRRRDYAVNLLQTIAETFLFYHPGVWWVSARVREAREHCCDDVAVEMCGEPSAYALALAELASWRSVGTVRESPIAAVGATDGSLLARVRRLLRAPQEDQPRSSGAWVVLALGTLLTAGVAVQSARPSAQGANPVQPSGAEWRDRDTEHFVIRYQSDLDLHAERVAAEAELAYARVSSDLKHQLAFKMPLLLLRTGGELQTMESVELHASWFADPTADRIVFALDEPVDRWLGIITHEVTHIFTFDILPGRATPLWVLEGLAEFERGSWDPNDLVTLREAVRGGAIPRVTALQRHYAGTNQRLAWGLGHAAFDFIESRWGKARLRLFLFALRQNALSGGGDPYERAFEIGRAEFDRAFERYLSERFVGSPRAGQ